MPGFRAALASQGTLSARGLQAALGTSRTTVRSLLGVAAVEKAYRDAGGPLGRLGLPRGGVELGPNGDASRRYTGGLVRVRRDGGVGDGLVQITHAAQLSFRGIHCLHQQHALGGLFDSPGPDDVRILVTISQSGLNAGFSTQVVLGGEDGFQLTTDEELFLSVPVGPQLIPLSFDLNVTVVELDNAALAQKVANGLIEAGKDAALLLTEGMSSLAVPADGPTEGIVADVAGALGDLAATVLGSEDDIVGTQTIHVTLARLEAAADGTFGPNAFNLKFFMDGGDDGAYDLFFQANLVLVSAEDS